MARPFEPSPALGNADVGALKSMGLWIPAIYASRAWVVRSSGQPDALLEFSNRLEGMAEGTAPERLLPSNLGSLLQASAQQPRHHQHLRFLLGKQAYSTGNHALAHQQLASVQPGNFSPRALLYLAAIEVRERRSVPAIAALMRAMQQLDAGIGGVVDEQRLRTTILLSMARIYFASSVTFDLETRSARVESKRISAAYKYYQQVLSRGGDVPEVAYELALLALWTGNDALVGGVLNVLLASGFRSPLVARAHLLRAVHALNACRDTEAKQELGAYHKHAEGLAARISEVLRQASSRNAESAFASLILTAPQPAPADSALDGIVQSARGDHSIAGLLTWLRQIDEQRGILARNPNLAQSAMGPAIVETLDHERAYAISSLSNRVREHLEYARDQLLEADADAARLSEYINRPDAKGRVSQSEAQIFGVVHLPNLLLPHPWLPSAYRHLEAGYFHEAYRSECVR